ncbi:PaaI family thioesterase [[Mycobacterium] wendilense]|uniref:Acyl-coenzyme A thioesterase THEM4 n=1 Tax=[Mycobacterium] wendilense TaxID=3064284 RepID=A0ABN9P9K9_9MYCO|nr:PaaI family thioesterase [Mycolicibacterium sp. MU0050]CAJ1587362.1 PaaI family thioesterase [Mycolicibacterium sp. MU0050]
MTRDLTPDEKRHSEALYAPVAAALRELIDVTIRSDVDDADVRRAQALIEEAAGLLGSRLDPGPPSSRSGPDGRPLTWGNVAFGVRNAIAFPLQIERAENGRVTTDLNLGAPYEGPAGHLHGGISALILDHVLSATAHRPEAPAFTGTLTLRYVAPTPLGRVRAEAWTDREERGKTFAVGHLLDAAGPVTVRAEGVFIRPRPPQ